MFQLVLLNHMMAFIFNNISFIILINVVYFCLFSPFYCRVHTVHFYFLLFICTKLPEFDAETPKYVGVFVI